MNKKIDFVKKLGNIIAEVQPNVTNIEYRTFKNTENDEIVEFLIIHYIGGGMSVRNCTGNSYSAIVSEIARYLDRGYYDEIYAFKNISTHWEEVK